MRFSFSMLLALLLVGGCGGAEQPGYERAEPAQAITPDEASPDEAADLGGPAVPPGFVDRKIVYTATVDLVVEDFDPVPAEIDALMDRDEELQRLRKEYQAITPDVPMGPPPFSATSAPPAAAP